MSNFSHCESFCFKFKKSKITTFFQSKHTLVFEINKIMKILTVFIIQEMKSNTDFKNKKTKRGRNIKSRPVFVVQGEDVFRFFNNAQLHFSLVHQQELGEVRIIVTSSFCRCLDCGDLSGGGCRGQEGLTTTGS